MPKLRSLESIVESRLRAVLTDTSTPPEATTLDAIKLGIDWIKAHKKDADRFGEFFNNKESTDDESRDA